MTEAMYEEKRINLILAKDKIKNPKRFSTILRKETELFLNNFFQIEKNTLSISVNILDNGNYDIVIKCKATRILNYN